MNILVDDNISYAQQAFSRFGKVKLVPGRTISKEHLVNTDILIVRSVTQINRKLLDDATVKFIGTTTIGTDHFDINYLKKRRIKFAHAPGCNSQAVAEYVISSILKIAAGYQLSLHNKKIGIIGYGNIGTKVAKFSRILGLEVVINDPPKEREGMIESSSLEDVLDCDIVTLHVPLILKGRDKTFHLLGDKELSLLRNKSILINTSRGPVINNNELLQRLKNNPSLFSVLDVWENEPDIDQHLLDLVNIATPHIAGYSLEGKVNGTKMIYDELCKFLNVNITWEPKLPPVSNNVFSYNSKESLLKNLNCFTSAIVNLEEDTSKLKQVINLGPTELVNHFDSLRKNYKLRREFKNYTVKLDSKDIEIIKTLARLGFNVKSNRNADLL